MAGKKGKGVKYAPKGVDIIYEDRDILVVDKSAGLLTMTKLRDPRPETAKEILTNYIRKGQIKSRIKLYLVHRLDRDTSGVLIFAKTEKVKDTLKDNWASTKKTYLVAVHGHLKEKEGTFTSYLAENKDYTMYSTKNPEKGKLSHTAYKVLLETKKYSLVEVDLLTGRKNQIRVHFAEKGYPVVGDVKYGKKEDKHRRMALHSYAIAFNHPFSKTRMAFHAEIPKFFTDLVGEFEAPAIPE